MTEDVKASQRLAIRLVKYDQTYLIRYRHDTFPAAICQLGHWAENPALNFDWHDADFMRRMILRRANCRSGEILE